MSIQIEEIAKEFLSLEKFFSKLGFEIVGSKDINEDKIYLIRRKKSNS